MKKRHAKASLDLVVFCIISFASGCQLFLPPHISGSMQIISHKGSVSSDIASGNFGIIINDSGSNKSKGKDEDYRGIVVSGIEHFWRQGKSKLYFTLSNGSSNVVWIDMSKIEMKVQKGWMGKPPSSLQAPALSGIKSPPFYARIDSNCQKTILWNWGEVIQKDEMNDGEERASECCSYEITNKSLVEIGLMERKSFEVAYPFDMFSSSVIILPILHDANMEMSEIVLTFKLKETLPKRWKDKLINE